jgi:multidrug efflux pump subunit AcrB
VLVLAAGSFAGGLALIPLIPQGFIPTLDRGECEVRFALPPGSGLAATDAVAARLIDRVRSDADVSTVLAVAGLPTGEADRGRLQVALRADRRSATTVVEQRLRRALAAESGAQVSVENVPIIAVAAAQPLEIALTGNDPVALAEGARRVRAQVATWAGVADPAIAGAGATGDGTWLRRDGHPAALVRANLAGVALGTVDERVNREVPALLPPSVHVALGGESAQAAEVFGHFASAVGLALVGVLVVLLLLFRSWQDPLAIAISLPLSAVGALLGLFAARSDFGIVSLLGLVFLTGLVNKNAIILVDRVNQLRAGGAPCEEAILEAGPVRLRPILMTTAAAVLGMLPIALGLGTGAELRAPMAVAIIGGLLTSTLLSLIVVPVVYQLLDRFRPRFVRRPALR